MKKAGTILMAAALTLSMAPFAFAEATTEAGNTDFVNELGKVRYLDKEWKYTEDGKQIIHLYYCQDQFDESTQDELYSVEDRVEELNAERDDIFIEFMGSSDSQSNLSKQIADVEAAISMNPDVILIKCVDSVGIIPSLQEIYDAGIYVIEQTGCDTDYVDVHWQALDEITIGRKLAEYVKEYLEENPDVNFKAGLIWGAPEQVEQLKRLVGFQELAEEMPDRFEIVAEQYGMWETAEAQNIMEDWIQAYPDMNFIATAADQMTLGAANALRSADRLQDFYIASCNGLEHDLKLMAAGEIQVFAGFITQEYIGKMVDCAVGVCLGEYAGQDNHMSNAANATFICTSDNLDEYKTLKGITE